MSFLDSILRWLSGKVSTPPTNTPANNPGMISSETSTIQPAHPETMNDNVTPGNTAGQDSVDTGHDGSDDASGSDDSGGGDSGGWDSGGGGWGM